MGKCYNVYLKGDIIIMVKWVNIAKGIAIFLVVYGHVIEGLAEGGYMFASYEVQHGIIYAFHMPLFFFLSGLFLTKILGREFTTVLKSRALTLLYPYFLWGTIQGSIMAILSKFTNGGGGWEKVILLPIDPFGQFWYLYDLFFMTLLFYGLNKLLKNNHLVFLVATILFIATPLMSGWEFSRIFHHFIFLVLGSLFFKYEQWFDSYRYWVISALTVISIIAFYSNLELLKFLAYGLLGTVLTIVVSRVVKANLSLEFLGKKSLSIYLFHILAIAGSRIILTKFLGFTNIPSLIVILTIAGTLFPLVVDYIATKLRMTKFIYGK